MRARAAEFADEVMRLRAPRKDATDTIVEPGDMLVFVAGHAPIQGTQSLYFRDPVFLQRSQVAAPELMARLGGMHALRPFALSESREAEKDNS